VEDEKHGEIGVLNRVLDYSANPLLEVKKDFKEILIPINDDSILEVDRENKVLKVRTTEGLVDLFLGSTEDDDEDF